jgi:acyl carrier protein
METSVQPIVDYFAAKDSRLKINGHDVLTIDLYQQGIVDSVGILELVSFLEEQYNVAFQPEDLDAANFRNIGQIMKLLNQRRNGN